MLEGLTGAQAVSDFLNDTSLSALKATVFDDGAFRCTTDMSATDKGEKGVVDVLFVRRNQTPLSPDNMGSCLDVHTSHGHPLDNLYHTLKGVWCPALLQNAENSENLPPRVQQLLAELETTLGSSVRSGPAVRGDDLADVSGINSFADEVDYWGRLADDRRSPSPTLSIATGRPARVQRKQATGGGPALRLLYARRRKRLCRRERSLIQRRLMGHESPD